MPTLELNLIVPDAVSRVLESMCFASILDEVVEPEQEQSSWIAAKLTFTGEPSGSFGLGVSLPSACSLAANFLGVDAEELSPTQMEEVVSELTNMIAGSLVSHFETDTCFTLSHPEKESATEFQKQLQTAGGRVFQLEDGLLAVWLQI